MSNLCRTRQGNFLISDACEIEDIKNNNYRLIDIKEVLNNYKKVVIKDNMLFKIKNGQIVDFFFDLCYNYIMERGKEWYYSIVENES